MQVGNLMSGHPVTIRRDADYKEALAVMQERALHHVPVVDEDEHLVGIVTERDLMLASLHYMGAAAEVAEVMHDNVIIARRGTPLADAATLMLGYRVGGLPVLDEDDRVVGVITETDVFRAFVAHERGTYVRAT